MARRIILTCSRWRVVREQGNVVEEASLQIAMGGHFVFSAEQVHFESIGDRLYSKLKLIARENAKPSRESLW